MCSFPAIAIACPRMGARLAAATKDLSSFLSALIATERQQWLNEEKGVADLIRRHGGKSGK